MINYIMVPASAPVKLINVENYGNTNAIT